MTCILLWSSNSVVRRTVFALAGTTSDIKALKSTGLVWLCSSKRSCNSTAMHHKSEDSVVYMCCPVVLVKKVTNCANPKDKHLAIVLPTAPFAALLMNPAGLETRKGKMRMDSFLSFFFLCFFVGFLFWSRLHIHFGQAAWLLQHVGFASVFLFECLFYN